MPTTTAVRDPEDVKPRFEYFISRNGVPCRMVLDRVICRKLIPIPCLPGEALTVIGSGYSVGARTAKRRVQRIERFLAQLRAAGFDKNTIFEKTDRMKMLMEPAVFKVDKRPIPTTDTKTTA